MFVVLLDMCVILDVVLLAIASVDVMNHDFEILAALLAVVVVINIICCHFGLYEFNLMIMFQGTRVTQNTNSRKNGILHLSSRRDKNLSYNHYIVSSKAHEAISPCIANC